MGHYTPLLHFSNKLAKRGHRISFFVPRTTISKLQHLNLHPHLITFIPITVPHVHGLPREAETTSDVPFSLFPLIATAMDQTENDIELLLQELNPKIVFFDFQHWLPNITRKLGIKSMQYWILYPFAMAYFDKGPRQEIDGPYTDFLENFYKKPCLLSGPLLPEPSNIALEEKWKSWLDRFKPGSVVYCAFGSETPLQQSQFQELLLGLELTGFPFLAASKPPVGFDSIEEALPEGFKERVEERGVVYGGWVQQQLVLEHPSVGCFITHCGSASITEALVNTCQIVLLPRLGADHVMNARMMSMELKVGIEIEKGEEDGLFTKESVFKAVKIVMDDESEVGREVRENHSKVKNFLLSKDFETSCLDSFCRKLQDIL
ncbi:hypothetical protein Ahy_B05g078725 isoform C [Arachis hypogaea]|uniref:UDP-glycosyltransferases domain-containing protein n=1 Tax=Arachis hypogaea TaxID=3818 RepID=A0A444Z7W3_ARAHY|nr:hypothetical protein Ahy_B05g078725 isoform C [Arachis hypogaea]